MKVFEKLETREHVKLVTDEKSLKSPTDEKSLKSPEKEKRYGNKPAIKKTLESKCWYFENGFCRKGIRCSHSHPSVMCLSFWNSGECPNGDLCPNRHPVRVCTQYLNGTCRAGKNCVHQHPTNQTSSTTGSSSGNAQPSPTSNCMTGQVYSNQVQTENQNLPSNVNCTNSGYAQHAAIQIQNQGNQFGHPSHFHQGQGWHH